MTSPHAFFWAREARREAGVRGALATLHRTSWCAVFPDFAAEGCAGRDRARDHPTPLEPARAWFTCGGVLCGAPAARPISGRGRSCAGICSEFLEILTKLQRQRTLGARKV